MFEINNGKNIEEKYKTIGIRISSATRATNFQLSVNQYETVAQAVQRTCFPVTVSANDKRYKSLGIG